MRAAPPAPAANAEPGRHARHSPPWRQVARRPLTAAVLLGGVLAMAITVAGLLVSAASQAGAPARDGQHRAGRPDAAGHAGPAAEARHPHRAAPGRAADPGHRAAHQADPAGRHQAGHAAGAKQPLHGRLVYPQPAARRDRLLHHRRAHRLRYRGPGVFYRLRELHPGNQIYVLQADGRLAVFRVTAVHRYRRRTSHGRRLRPGARCRAAPDHLWWHVRLRHAQLPQQHRRRQHGSPLNPGRPAVPAVPAGYQPRAGHSGRCGRSAPSVVSWPWPGYTRVPSGCGPNTHSSTSSMSWPNRCRSPWYCPDWGRRSIPAQPGRSCRGHRPGGHRRQLPYRSLIHTLCLVASLGSRSHARTRIECRDTIPRSIPSAVAAPAAHNPAAPHYHLWRLPGC